MRNLTKNMMDNTYSDYYLKYNSGISSTDVLGLFNLEESFRRIALSVILEFECKVKKNLVNYIDANSISRDFWLDKNFFKSSFTNVRRNNVVSKYELFINDVMEKYSKLGFLNLSTGWRKYPLSSKIGILVTANTDIDKVLFFISFGSFEALLSGLKASYFSDFFNNSIATCSPRYEDHSYFILFRHIRLLRNRCAHSNHILSTHCYRQITSNLNIDGSESIYFMFDSPLLKALVFLLKDLDNLSIRYYMYKLIELVAEYEELIDKYHSDLNLEEDLLKKLNNFNKSI